MDDVLGDLLRGLHTKQHQLQVRANKIKSESLLEQWRYCVSVFSK